MFEKQERNTDEERWRKKRKQNRQIKEREKMNLLLEAFAIFLMLFGWGGCLAVKRDF